jgi:hypothetical protein
MLGNAVCEVGEALTPYRERVLLLSGVKLRTKPGAVVVDTVIALRLWQSC